MRPLERLRGPLRSEGFRGALDDDAGTRTVYGTDNSIYQLTPVGAALPESADDLIALARANHSLSEPFDLVARGGGTGTNGQSLTNGLVVDLRRTMNSIVSIDIEAATAIVQPGVVLGQLNAVLAPSGFFFAPHVSTSSRATIGGMVATDAAGKGSLVHGRTNDHVLAVDAVLADGTPWTFRPITLDEAHTLATRADRIGDIHRAALATTEGLGPDAFPDVPRGFTGYNLGDARSPSGQIDLTKLLCGSEGTLALISQVKLRLTRLPTEPNLALIAYPRFEDAVRDSNRLKATMPMAIECLDERTISLATASPAWPTLASLLNAEGGSLLLLEYEGSAGVGALRDLLPEADGATAMAVTANPSEIAAVWKVRADAVGLLGQSVNGRRSVAFVEDCAVPPHHLEAFVAGYRQLLDGHGLSYGMFGHADVGCVHVRPALDLYRPDHERLIRTISDEVATLVSSFGGVLWGEHGRGFRGEYLDLSDDVVHRMRMIKTAFDPRNILNPGKLYAPLDDAPPIKRIDEVPLRIHRDRTVAETARDEFDSAFGCNGNGICHHWGTAEVMCPSFKATADPRLSPKGRADLLRAWLIDPDDAELADDVADSMRQCLSCGACTGRCPVQVDIPEMKSRFFEQHGEQDPRRKARDMLLSRFESLLPLAQSGGRATALAQRLSSPALSRLLGIVDLPTLPAGGLDQRLEAMGVEMLDGDPSSTDATVIILPDAFTAFIEPHVLEATLRLMQRMGERPAVAKFLPSGKYDHVKGRRDRFRRAVAARRTQLERLAPLGLDLVSIEPAVFLLHQHEYPAIDPDFPARATTSLPTFLNRRIDRLPQLPRREPTESVQLFGHCTEVSLAPHHTVEYRRLLERAGFTVEVESTTCCGMAGIFGHEAEHQTMSTALFVDGWGPLLDRSDAGSKCGAGYSCRSQTKRLSAHHLSHPVELLDQAFQREGPTAGTTP